MTELLLEYATDISRKLQLMKDLMLVLTIEMVRQTEEVDSQVSMQVKASGVIHKVTHKCSKYTKHQKRRKDKRGKSWTKWKVWESAAQ